MGIGTEAPHVPRVEPTPAQVAARQAAEAQRALQERQDRAVLAGGEEHEVTLRPGGTEAPGEGTGPTAPLATEAVWVPLISVRQYQEFFVRQNDEVALIALVCGKPPEWVESLTPASHAVLIDAVLALNFPWVIAWADRQNVVTESMAGVGAGAGAGPRAAAASSRSPSSAREPASPSGAGAV